MIELALLNKHDLTRYWDISAMDAQGASMPVWESRRLVPFGAAESPGSLMEHGMISVPSLSTTDLEPVYSRLAEVDPHGDRRLVR